MTLHRYTFSKRTERSSSDREDVTLFASVRSRNCGNSRTVTRELCDRSALRSYS
ncbi:MAG TPA: hypothetical protein V6C91_13115 [Coleofasciculaceae cyanobacterium]